MQRKDLEPPTPDEEVNGPKIAADILNRMHPARKERLMSIIQKRDPKLALRIEKNLFTFHDIHTITAQGMQIVNNTLDPNDLLHALQGANDRLTAHFLNNMSQRRQRMLQDQLRTLPHSTPEEIQEAQHRIVQIVEDLRASGRIRTESVSDLWV